MATITQVAAALQTVLGPVADDLASSTRFIRRRRKITGSGFVRSLVFGWLDDPQATLQGLAGATVRLGVPVVPQSLAERFTPEAAELLRGVLREAVARVVAGGDSVVPLLRRFPAVLVLDSSTIGLPEALAESWPGKGSCDPGAGNAALKLTVGLDLVSGRLHGPDLQPGRAADSKAPLAGATLPPGSLRIADLGYFDLAAMARLSAGGTHWLSRLKAGTRVFTADGRRWASVVELLESRGTDEVELAVELGVEQRLPCRLLAERVPPEVAEARRTKLREDASRQRRKPREATVAMAGWTILVSDAPAELLSLAEAMVLRRARWQVELLFKLWKSHGRVDESRSRNPVRVLCEAYAKLIAMVVQHWVTLVGRVPRDERSPTKVAAMVRSLAWPIALSLGRPGRLRELLRLASRCIAAGCRTDPRCRTPSTRQRLQSATQTGLT